MLREEYGEEQCPAFNRGRIAIWTQAIVTEEVDERCSRNTAKPCQEAEAIEPGADCVRSPRSWTLHVYADFDCVGAELNPVIYKERNSSEWPDNTEEG